MAVQNIYPLSDADKTSLANAQTAVTSAKSSLQTAMSQLQTLELQIAQTYSGQSAVQGQSNQVTLADGSVASIVGGEWLVTEK